MENKNLKPKQGKVIELSGKKGRGVLEVGKKIYIGTVNIFIPPLAHFHTGRYKNKKHHYVLDTFLALLIFVLLGIGLYYRAQIRSIFFDEITVALTTGEQLTCGQDATFNLNIANQTSYVLKDFVVRFDIDKQIQLTEEVESLVVNELAPNETKELSFAGQPLGMVGDQLTIKTFITYTGQDSQRGGVVATDDFRIDDSIFSISVDAPDAVSTGQPFNTKVSLAGKKNLPKGTLTASLPDSLLIRSTSPATTDQTWEISQPDKTKEIELSSAFLESALEQEKIVFEYSKSVDTKKIDLARSEVPIKVISPQVALQVATNTKTLNPAAKAQITVDLQNTSQEELSDASITCSLQGEGFLLGSAQGIVEQSRVTFTSKTSDLGKIPAGGQGRVQFSVTAPSTVVQVEQASIACSLSGTSSLNGESVEIMVYSQSIDLSVLPSVAFSAYGNFSAGPLPPQVGLPTIYRLFFEISDPGKSIHDMKVTASLPVGVEYLGSTSTLAGKAVVYDQASQTITWQIDRYPQEIDKLSASFEVRIIPNQNHLGAAHPLLLESNLAYSYAYQTEQNNLKADHLTTRLGGDNQPLEEGIVVE